MQILNLMAVTPERGNDQILKGLRTMKAEAENKIAKILADVWGVETVEAEVS